MHKLIKITLPVLLIGGLFYIEGEAAAPGKRGMRHSAQQSQVRPREQYQANQGSNLTEDNKESLDSFQDTIEPYSSQTDLGDGWTQYTTTNLITGSTKTLTVNPSTKEFSSLSFNSQSGFSFSADRNSDGSTSTQSTIRGSTNTGLVSPTGTPGQFYYSGTDNNPFLITVTPPTYN